MAARFNFERRRRLAFAIRICDGPNNIESIKPCRLHVFHYAHFLRIEFCQFDGPIDGVFDEAELIDQSQLERLLGGEDLAGRGFGEFFCIAGQLRPGFGHDAFELHERLIDQVPAARDVLPRPWPESIVVLGCPSL